MPLMPRTMNTDAARAMVAFAAAQLAAEMSRSFNYDELAAIFAPDNDENTLINIDQLRAMNACARLMLADFSDRDVAAIGHCAYNLMHNRYGNIDRRIYDLCETVLHNRHN